jgi:hypothetical protein
MSVSLINGHIDLEITPEMRLATFNDELEELVDMFYDGCQLCQSKYFEDISEEVLLEDAIRHLFSRYKDIISIYSIETDTCFESCGYDVGVISIAFVNPITGLEHHLLRWERV